jgi:predicted RND superfamily exporter protein
MSRSDPSRLSTLFRRIVAWRVGFLAAYALLLPLAIFLALRVESDNSIDRLVVRSDADFQANEAFQKLFPEGEHVVLLAESAEPFSPEALRKIAEIESALSGLPGVTSLSALSIYRRARPGAKSPAEEAEDFRRFVLGTDLFRQEGLAGPGFLSIPVEFHTRNPAARNKVLARIDEAMRPALAAPAPLQALRRVGGPYVDAYLEAETARASVRYFPLFGVFIIAINLALYRSLRTLAAFLITITVSVAFTMAFAAVAGFVSTIVSSVVPLTILITCSAALVYIQSRFSLNPEGHDPAEHQIFTLANKFLATTASLFAAAIGFAALAVSRIRPIREMGIWVAAGLLLTWVVVFTLFPALQRVLRTPMPPTRTGAGRLLLRLIDALPSFSYRWRWMLLGLTLALMIAGALAVTGVPGRLEPMQLETDELDYIDRSLPLYEDTRRLEKAIGGLSLVQAWITAPPGAVLDPEVLRGMEDFSRALQEDPRVGSVSGPTTVLRWMSYVGGGSDRLSGGQEVWQARAAQLESLLLQEPALRSTIDVDSLAHARLTILYQGAKFPRIGDLQAFVAEAWRRAGEGNPALSHCRLRVVGQGLLQAKIAEYLVPTLTESFALTAGIIFVAFLLVFRSGAARLMAMIPSLFAILVMFLVMRVTGIPLNVATILIASTVLGATENDQIHFFYHFQERRTSGSTEEALRHALLIAGRAIVFATFINAGGFLALALSGLPPMRQFGIISSSAFVLSMLASFTALPAALWIFFREAPDERRGGLTAGGARIDQRGSS